MTNGQRYSFHLPTATSSVTVIDGRAGHRNDHVPEQTQVVAAIEPGGLDHLARQAAEGLAEEKGAEGDCRPRQDDALVGVDPALAEDIGEGDVVRQDRHLLRHHQAGQDDEEDDVFAREAQEDECVGSTDGVDHFDRRAGDHDDQAVDVEASERRRMPGVDVVAPAGIGWQPGGGIGEDFLGGLERSREHPEERRADNDHRHAAMAA